MLDFAAREPSVGLLMTSVVFQSTDDFAARAPKVGLLMISVVFQSTEDFAARAPKTLYPVMPLVLTVIAEFDDGSEPGNVKVKELTLFGVFSESVPLVSPLKTREEPLPIVAFPVTDKLVKVPTVVICPVFTESVELVSKTSGLCTVSFDWYWDKSTLRTLLE